MIRRTHRGNRGTYLNSSGAQINSGDVVVLELSVTTGKIGVAEVNIPNGSQGQLNIGHAPMGVIELPKLSGDTFTQYQTVYWDPSAKNLTTTSTNNTRAGRSEGNYAPGTTLAFCVINQ